MIRRMASFDINIQLYVIPEGYLICTLTLLQYLHKQYANQSFIQNLYSEAIVLVLIINFICMHLGNQLKL